MPNAQLLYLQLQLPSTYFWHCTSFCTASNWEQINSHAGCLSLLGAVCCLGAGFDSKETSIAFRRSRKHLPSFAQGRQQPLVLLGLKLRFIQTKARLFGRAKTAFCWTGLPQRFWLRTLESVYWLVTSLLGLPIWERRRVGDHSFLLVASYFLVCFGLAYWILFTRNDKSLHCLCFTSQQLCQEPLTRSQGVSYKDCRVICGQLLFTSFGKQQFLHRYLHRFYNDSFETKVVTIAASPCLRTLFDNIFITILIRCQQVTMPFWRQWVMMSVKWSASWLKTRILWA